MYDAEIRAEIGEDQVFSADEFTAIIKTLTTKQSKGEDGTLLTNGYANIFYVRDAEGELRAVSVNWHAGYRGWRVSAYSVARQGRWLAGLHVFSRPAKAA